MEMCINKCVRQTNSNSTPAYLISTHWSTYPTYTPSDTCCKYCKVCVHTRHALARFSDSLWWLCLSVYFFTTGPQQPQIPHTHTHQFKYSTFH